MQVVSFLCSSLPRMHRTEKMIFDGSRCLTELLVTVLRNMAHLSRSSRMKLRGNHLSSILDGRASTHLSSSTTTIQVAGLRAMSPMKLGFTFVWDWRDRGRSE